MTPDSAKGPPSAEPTQALQYLPNLASGDQEEASHDQGNGELRWNYRAKSPQEKERAQKRQERRRKREVECGNGGM